MLAAAGPERVRACEGAKCGASHVDVKYNSSHTMVNKTTSRAAVAQLLP
jgi:hypothetical protein